MLRFKRSAAAKSEKYTSLVSHADKAAFRRAWAMEEHKAKLERKVSKSEVSDEAGHKGKYMTFEGLVTEFGSNNPAVTYMRNCQARGGVWVTRNEMADVEMYWYVSKHTKAWRKDGWSLEQEDRCRWSTARMKDFSSQGATSPLQSHPHSLQKNSPRSPPPSERLPELHARTQGCIVTCLQMRAWVGGLTLQSPRFWQSFDSESARPVEVPRMPLQRITQPGQGQESLQSVCMRGLHVSVRRNPIHPCFGYAAPPLSETGKYGYWFDSAESEGECCEEGESRSEERSWTICQA